MFRNLKEDWRTYDRNPYAPGFWIMVVYRFGRWRYRIPWRPVRLPFSFAYRLAFTLITIITGAEFPCEVRIGRRLRIDHPQGLVVSGDACLGDDVILRNGVTIGLRRTGTRGSPVLGNRVDVGAGAKILGNIRIGDDTSIGANSVVLADIPNGSVAFGVPAKIRALKYVNQWRLDPWREEWPTVS